MNEKWYTTARGKGVVHAYKASYGGLIIAWCRIRTLATEITWVKEPDPSLICKNCAKVVYTHG